MRLQLLENSLNDIAHISFCRSLRRAGGQAQQRQR
jgi:hypothetical protein